jgi:hypothetical protein
MIGLWYKLFSFHPQMVFYGRSLLTCKFSSYTMVASNPKVVEGVKRRGGVPCDLDIYLAILMS